MTPHVLFRDLSESEVCRLADDVAFLLQPGDTLRLEGDLGAGKTTFARALIRALTRESALEVPSPTFTLVQSYAGPRFEIAHFDLYRITSENDLDELGFDNALQKGIAIVEWPERAATRLAQADFTVSLSEAVTDDRRNFAMSSSPERSVRLARLSAIAAFLDRVGWGGEKSRLSYLQGDASPRRYARLSHADGRRAILMDSPKQPDGPPIRDGLPYSRIAHLAEDVTAFAAIGAALQKAGFSVPEIYAHDFDQGFLLIEDLGDTVFGQEVARGRDLTSLWRRAVDTLVALREAPPNGTLELPGGAAYTLRSVDPAALNIETELLTDWYWPAFHGAPPPHEARSAYHAHWQPVFERVLRNARGWLLRDYHSPNLLALDGRAPPRDVGIIDFQDAMIGPEAYDLVSLLQDARLDVAPNIEAELLNHYCESVAEREPGFDAAEFRFAYAALGAQRNSKILGIFTRLAVRDGKRQYLAHIPRIWAYLARDLEHAELAQLKAWYDAHFPAQSRLRAISV